MAASQRPRHRSVKVSFFRAVKGARGSNDGSWIWPADDDVANTLVERFDAAEHVHPEWPFTVHWARTMLVEVHERQAPGQFEVATVRTDDLPLVLRDGTRRGVPLDIGDRDRLLEPSYLTFFPNRIVGFVRHEHTPSSSMCAGALARLTGVDLQLVPIVRGDILERVRDGWGVTSYDLTIAAGSVDEAVETDDAVLAAARLVAPQSGTEKVSIRMTAESAQQKRSLRLKLIRLLERRGLADVDAAHARIASEDGSEVVDLLQDEVARRTTVPITARTRHLLPHEAHEATQRVFELERLAITRAIELAE